MAYPCPHCKTELEAVVVNDKSMLMYDRHADKWVTDNNNDDITFSCPSCGLEILNEEFIQILLNSAQKESTRRLAIT